MCVDTTTFTAFVCFLGKDVGFVSQLVPYATPHSSRLVPRYMLHYCAVFFGGVLMLKFSRSVVALLPIDKAVIISHVRH